MTAEAGAASPLAVTYVLPLRTDVPLGGADVAYVRWLATSIDDVVVVDGSPHDVFDAHVEAFGDVARVTRPDVAFRSRNGKVAGVLTGIALAEHDAVVIADDDIRYPVDALRATVARLEAADAVMPQSVYRPLPWHARWDTGRILLHRAFGADMGGTVAVNRPALVRVGGYDGDVLFENLELLRTIRAAGGVVDHARDVYVRRVPPNGRHFAGQRVRQAYDEFARPWLLAVWLAIVPTVAWLVRRRGRRAWLDLWIGALASIALAEFGRRRDGGSRVFARGAALWAPPWIAERAVCAWLALGARLRGGVRYRGDRLARAASSTRTLRRALATAEVAT